MRVLVVDDDADMRRLMRVMLEAEGYSVDEVPGGAEAVALLRETDEPLVGLLDHLMPDVTGTDVLRMAASEGGNLRIHGYIMISADENREALDLAASIARLSVAVLTKPIARSALTRTLRQLRASVDVAATKES